MDERTESSYKKMSTTQLRAKAKKLILEIEKPGIELAEVTKIIDPETAERTQLIDFVISTSALIASGSTASFFHVDDDLVAQIEALNLEYHQVTFPMTYEEDGLYHFASGQALGFTEIGAGYLSERIKDVPYKFWTHAFREGPEQLYALIKLHESRLVGRTYVVPTTNGKILSFMASYNPYNHMALIADILEAGIAPKISEYRVLQTHLELLLSFSTIGNVEVGMFIKNGHSGHFAMSFKVYIRTKDTGWEYFLDINKVMDSKIRRRRHLSLLDEVRTSLSETYHALAELNFLALLEQPASLFLVKISELPYLSARQLELVTALSDQVENGEIATISDALAMLAPFSNTRGYLSSVAGIIDPVLEELCKTWSWKV